MAYKKLSEQIHDLLKDGGPPYDTEKVMDWFNRNAGAMFIQLDILEDDYDAHNTAEMAGHGAEFQSDIDELEKLVLPHFKKYLEDTGCIRCATNRLLYLTDMAVYGHALHHQKYCQNHRPKET